MDIKFYPRKSDYRVHVLIEKFGQGTESEVRFQKHMRRKTDKQDLNSNFI